jgi:hypothetical protein
MQPLGLRQFERGNNGVFPIKHGWRTFSHGEQSRHARRVPAASVVESLRLAELPERIGAFQDRVCRRFAVKGLRESGPVGEFPAQVIRPRARLAAGLGSLFESRLRRQRQAYGNDIFHPDRHSKVAGKSPEFLFCLTYQKKFHS